MKRHLTLKLVGVAVLVGLVTSGWAAPKCYPTRYQIQAGALVFDTSTGLTWQQTVDAGSYAWSDAAKYCAERGDGWRVPSLGELQTIVDDTGVTPAIDGSTFPSTPEVDFWTSSPLGLTPGWAWAVSFGVGPRGPAGSTWYAKTSVTNRVRCVR